MSNADRVIRLVDELQEELDNYIAVNEELELAYDAVVADHAKLLEENEKLRDQIAFLVLPKKD